METRNPTLNLRGIAFALAAVTATTPTWVHAQGEPMTVHVYYGDLNLTSESGIAALDRRLDRAVERVCGRESIRSLAEQRSVTRCERETRGRISDDRQLAIARANGQPGLAENSPRGHTQVSRAD